MSNTIKAIGMAALLAGASAAHAEFIGLEVGIAGWRADPSGWVESERGSAVGGAVDLEQDLHLDSENTGFAWVRVVHPLPLLPNLKLSYSPMKFEGSGETSKEFSFRGTPISASEPIDSELQLNQWDAAFFYNLLDNIVELDLGINIKVLDGYVRATPQSGDRQNLDFTAPIPMLYGRIGVDVPFTNLYVGAEGSAIGYSGNRLADLKISARYTIAYVLGLEAGYRLQKLKLDDLDDISADIKVAGPYVGVTARF